MAERVLDAVERRALLDEYDAIDERLARGDTGGAELDELLGRRMQLILRYQDGFPLRPLSRCPFTAEVLALSIDPFDLDGLWWDWDAAVRGDAETPATLVALTGAMEVRARVPSSRRRCRPGPAVPHVLPDLLAADDVRAVLSSVEIGPHLGTLVAYYAASGAAPARVSDWGSSSTLVATPDGIEVVRASEAEEASWARDPDLERWLRAGKLEWIEPGDDELRLRAGVGDCPFLGRGDDVSLQEVIGGVVVHDAPSG